MPLPPKLQVLLCGESLFNDSVALVAFKLAVVAAVTAQFSAREAALSLLTVSLGGLATGAAVALAANALRRGLKSDTPDSVRIDTILSLLIPYAAYLASEKLAVSGVLAVVAAGLCGGVLDRRHLRAGTRLNGVALWSAVTLTLNGAVFVMLGLVMRQVLHRVEGYSRWHLLGYVALLTLALFALRMGWTALMAWWPGRSRPSGDAGLPGFKLLVITVLCGVRGSLALSATLSIPLLTAAGSGHARTRPGRLPGGSDDRRDAAAQWGGDAIPEGAPERERRRLPDGAGRPPGDRPRRAAGGGRRAAHRRLGEGGRMGVDMEAPV